MKVRDEWAGKRVKCPGCGEHVAIPIGLPPHQEGPAEPAVTAPAPTPPDPAPAHSNPPVAQGSVSLEDFWRTSWSVWRAGVLTPIGEGYARIAARDFDEFMKFSDDAKNPEITRFFTDRPPRPDEFLIGEGQSGKLVTMMLTSRRLWLYDKQTGGYLECDIEDVADFEFRAGWWLTGSATIRLKDGSQRTCHKTVSTPTEPAMRFVLDKCRGRTSADMVRRLPPGAAAPQSKGSAPQEPATPPPPIVRERFLAERVAFIAVAALITGLAVAVFGDPGSGAIALLLTGFLLTGVYVTAKTFMGIGGFYETVALDSESPSFDWGKFALEPLYLLGCVVAVFLFCGAVFLFRNYIWPIMKGD